MEMERDGPHSPIHPQWKWRESSAPLPNEEEGEYVLYVYLMISYKELKEAIKNPLGIPD